MEGHLRAAKIADRESIVLPIHLRNALMTRSDTGSVPAVDVPRHFTSVPTAYDRQGLFGLCSRFILEPVARGHIGHLPVQQS